MKLFDQGLQGDGDGRRNGSDSDKEVMVSCAYCGLEVSEDVAIEAGWEPYFFLTETKEAGKPCCVKCTVEHLMDFPNDPIIRGPEHVPPGMTLED